MCIVCDRPVGNHEDRIEEHVRGKKHIHYMRLNVNLCYQTYNSLVTLVKDIYNLELRVHTKQNMHILPVTLRGINVVDDPIISVAFLVENGCLNCLSLVWNGICINFDRTILEDHNNVTMVVELKKVFEGPCKVGGRNMWELMLVLFHQYGIRCQGVADLDYGSIVHAGVDVPRCNSKIHLQVAKDAADSYELVESFESKLLSFGTTPTPVLRHLCEYNLHMYAIYREIRETTLEVQWLSTRVNESRTVCKIKMCKL